jgi:hypothetical protein
MVHRILSISVILLTLNSSDGPETIQSTLDPNTAPITDGNWHRPEPETTWQWQLAEEVNTTVDVQVYDIDLFDTPLSTINNIHSKGIKVIAYFSGGSYEEWRDDASNFNDIELGNTLDGWPGERWLDIRSSNVHSLMQSRLDLAKEKGFDGVEPDNMDGYANNSGFDLSATDQLAFNRFIANEAHKRGLSVGLKNDLDQVTDLVVYFDFSVNEECFEYDECNALAPFIESGKAVFNAEYASGFVDDVDQRNTLCNQSNNLKFSTLVLPFDLDDSFRYSCR